MSTTWLLDRSISSRLERENVKKFSPLLLSVTVITYTHQIPCFTKVQLVLPTNSCRAKKDKNKFSPRNLNLHFRLYAVHTVYCATEYEIFMMKLYQIVMSENLLLYMNFYLIISRKLPSLSLSARYRRNKGKIKRNQTFRIKLDVKLH